MEPKVNIETADLSRDNELVVMHENTVTEIP